METEMEFPTLDEYVADTVLVALTSLPKEQRGDYLAYVIKSAREAGKHVGEIEALAPPVATVVPRPGKELGVTYFGH